MLKSGRSIESDDEYIFPYPIPSLDQAYRNTDLRPMFNISNSSSHLDQEWRPDIYRGTRMLGKVSTTFMTYSSISAELICNSLGVSNAFSKHVRQRYEHYFGPVNQHFMMANHSLILLDSPGIVDEDYIRAGHGTSFEEWIPLRDGAIEFVKGLAAGLYTRFLCMDVKIDRASSLRGTSQTCYTI
jgi:hypothetical protein